MRWSYGGVVWVDSNKQSTLREYRDGVPECLVDENGDGVLDCCIDFDEAQFTSTITYFVVTAYNQWGESPTEHGEVIVP